MREIRRQVHWQCSARLHRAFKKYCEDRRLTQQEVLDRLIMPAFQSIAEGRDPFPSDEREAVSRAG